MLVVDYASLEFRRDHLAGSKIRLMIQRKGHQLTEFLGRQEFVKHDAARRQDRWKFCDRRRGLALDRRVDGATRRLRLDDGILCSLGLIPGRLRFDGRRRGGWRGWIT